MSILDTFFIMFDSNSEAVKKGLDDVTRGGKQAQTEINKTGEAGVKSAHEIGEANNKLGESFDKLKEHYGELARTLIEHALEVAAAFKALFEVEKLVDSFFEQAETSEKLGFMAKQLGIGVEELDAWGQAAKREGGTAEGFAASLDNLNLQLARISVTGHSRSLKFFQQLGIDATHAKNAFELLPQLADKFSKMDNMRSAAFGRAIGLDAGTIRLLQSGREEIDKLMARQKMLGNVSEESTKIAHEFEDQWLDINQLFRNIVIDSDNGILPLFTELLHAVEEFVVFLRDHKDVVIGFFAAIGIALAYLIAEFGLLDFLASPWIAIGAAVLAVAAAIGLLYDDLVVFNRGGKSLIGEIAKEWPIVGDAVRGFITVLAWARDIAVEVFHEIVDWIHKIPEGFRQWEEIIGFIGDKFSSFFASISEKLSKLPGGFGEIFGAIGTVIKDVFNGIVGTVEFTFNTLYEIVRAFVRAIGAGLKLIADLVVDPMHAFQKWGATMFDILDQLDKKLPSLGSVFQSVANTIAKVGEDIINVFKKIWAEVGWIIDRIQGALGIRPGMGGGNSGMGHGGRHVPQEAPGSIPGSAGGRHGANPTTDPLGSILDAPGVEPALPTSLTTTPAQPSASPSVAPTSEPSRPASAPSAAPIPSGIPGTHGNFSPSGALGTPALPGLMPTQVANDISSGQNVLASTQTPLLAQTAGSLGAGANNHVEIHNDNHIGAITVTGSSDPADAAHKIEQMLQEHYDKVMPNYATGVAQ